MKSKTHQLPGESRRAVYSDCERYRYLLEIIWDANKPLLQVIGLNPSTATEQQNDPTVAKCCKYARAWGFGALLMTNLFSFRATDPRVMIENEKRSTGSDVNCAAFNNNVFTLLGCMQIAEKVLCAWGNHGAFLNHAGLFLAMRSIPTEKLHCLAVNSTGEPKHPLYCRDDAEAVPYRRSGNG